MGKETPLAPRAEIERVRKKIAEVGTAALDVLAVELKEFGRRKIRGEMVTVPLPEEWARNFKTVADQLRRDLRLDAEDADDAPPAAVDPLAGLRVVGSKEAG